MKGWWEGGREVVNKWKATPYISDGGFGNQFDSHMVSLLLFLWKILYQLLSSIFISELVVLYRESLGFSHVNIGCMPILQWDNNPKEQKLRSKVLCTEGLTNYKSSQNPSKINNVSETQVVTTKNG